MASDDDLSADQTEKLLQFQDLIGIDEIERCKDILQRHNWDLEVAVQSRFSEEEGQPSIYQENNQQNERMPQVDINPPDQRVFTVASRWPTSLFGWGSFITMFPFRFVYYTCIDILKFVYNLLRPDPRTYVTDSVGDVNRFIESYEIEYGVSHPNFRSVSYSQALNDAKRDLQFLLVYIHGDDHSDTPQFCRDVLCNSEVIEFIDTNMAMWACNVNSPEGYRVSQAIRENTYPFLALVVLRNNRMTVVAKMEGLISSNELISKLRKVMDDNEAYLISVRAERQERSFNQTLREEQDRAYLESLKMDEEKERKRLEVIENKEKLKQQEELLLQQEQERLEEIVLKKEKLRNEIPEEPLQDDQNSVRILLKLPNGIRLDRRFLKNQSLEYLYNYVFVHEAAPDDFQIVTNFPRKVVPCDPSDCETEPPTFEEFGLGRSELLFVHDNNA